MPSIKDLARQCHCSPSTVARAFKDNSIIKPETKALILETAANIGYTPNALARGLKRSKSQTIGIVVPHVENNFYIDLIRGIETELQKKQYNLIVSFVSERYSALSERSALDSLLRARAEAIVLIPSPNINIDYLNIIRKQQYIIQMFNSPCLYLDSIVMNDAYGMQIAAEYLIDMGHRSIYCVHYRSDGYADALTKHGIVIDPGLISCGCRISCDEIKETLMKKHPSAMLVHADMASAAIMAIQELKLSIPDDISFIVYDDNPWAKLMQITAVGHPFEEISDTVVKMIFSRLDNPGDEKVINQIIDPFLKKRHSVRKLNDG